MENIFQCVNISKSYNSVEKPVLNKINFAVKKNEIFSIIGLNGAGKSTLLSIIAGILKPDKGEVVYSFNNFKAKLGFMPEIVNYPLSLSPFDILTSMKFLFKNINNDKIFNILKQLKIESFSKKPLKTFSKGMLQRFNLAQSIVHSPEVLILDEPFTGLDPLGRELFIEILFKLKKNTTIVFSSHILTDVERLSDRIAILDKGSIAAVLGKKDFSGKSLIEKFLKTIKPVDI